jgi:hypothetical protein
VDKRNLRQGGLYIVVNCDVIKDLIPLVNDDVASEESKKIVNNHCESCSDCSNLLTNKPSYKPKDEKIIKALKKSVLTTQLAIVSIGILIGIWFTGSNSTLYNFYIMPFVGGLAYFTLRKKSLYVPLFIIMLTELLQILRAIPYLKSGIVENLQSLGIIVRGALFYAVIYALLSVIGIAISFLLSYTFRRDKK